MRLPGQYHDAETGLHQNRWRSFDPSIGRYLSPDPLGLAGGTNLYAYAGQDPVNQTDPLGLFPGIEDLTAHVLGAKAGSQASQAYGQVQNLLHHHLSAATPPFLPTGPSPFGPNGLGSLPGMKPLNLDLPTYSLPGLPGSVNLGGGLGAGSLFNQGINGPLPMGHLHTQHAKHHVPPPAQAAHSCTPKPPPAHRPTPRPAPLPSDTTPIITAHDFFGGIGTGFRNIWDFRRGTQQASEDMINPIKIYQGTQELGGQLADVLVADPDGHKASGSALARNMGHGFVESINPFDKKNAYDIGYSTGNLGAVFVPAAGEVSALNDLRLGLKAATVSRDVAQASLKAAETAPEKAAAAARLRAAEERVAQVKAALREKIPGVKAVKNVKEVSAKVKQKVSTAQAAAKTAQERQLQARRLASGEEMKARWRNQTRGPHTGQRQPALAPAGHAPSGKHTRAIGQPGGKSGMMQMAGGGAEREAIARKPVIKPTGEAKGKPTGTPEEHGRRADAQKQHDIVRQNEAADALAYHGYKVEHTPKVQPADHLDPGRDPDYRIEGEVFDGYTPTKDRTLDKIRNSISDKVKKGQATRIVLNLTDSAVPMEDISNILSGHKEVKGGTYGPLNQVLGVRPKPGAKPIRVEAGTEVYAPQDMDVFQIFP